MFSHLRNSGTQELLLKTCLKQEPWETLRNLSIGSRFGDLSIVFGWQCGLRFVPKPHRQGDISSWLSLRRFCEVIQGTFVWNQTRFIRCEHYHQGQSTSLRGWHSQDFTWTKVDATIRHPLSGCCRICFCLEQRTLLKACQWFFPWLRTLLNCKTHKMHTLTYMVYKDKCVLLWDLRQELLHHALCVDCVLIVYWMMHWVVHFILSDCFFFNPEISWEFLRYILSMSFASGPACCKN